MSHYRHVVIGAGPAGVVCAETLAKHGNQGQVLLIGGEKEAPYSRMALPYYLIGKIREQGTHLRKNPQHLDQSGIVWRQAMVTKLDRERKTLALSDGGEVSYDKLCVASGASPIKPAIPGIDGPNIHHCWTLADGRAIIDYAKPGKKIVLMGAGFIGCIILEALALSGADLVVVEMGPRMVPRMLDDVCGTMLKNWCVSKGVNVYTGRRIARIENHGAKDTRVTSPATANPSPTGLLGKFKSVFFGDEVAAKTQAISHSASSAKAEPNLRIELDDGTKLDADLLVVAAGVKPNLSMLESSGLKIRSGLMVNDYMQTSDEHIYAAGDVAEAPNFHDNEWSVQAIQPVAADQGRIAALNMLGMETPYVGTMGMNVLDSLGLISTSFGQWQGVENGDSAVRVDEQNFRYTRLEFSGDVLVGAQTLGRTDHVGVVRGLIQNRTPLGKWKAKLQANPNLIMEAYVDLSQT